MLTAEINSSEASNKLVTFRFIFYCLVGYVVDMFNLKFVIICVFI